MKNRIFFSGIFLLFLAELMILLMFTFSGSEESQNTVAVNEVVKTVENDWDSLGRHSNRTSLEYVVLGANGTVLYRTKDGLSESINAAISHKDTILDVTVNGSAAGKVILYNTDRMAFQAEKRSAVLAILAAMLLQCCICAGYFFYLQRMIIKPFRQMKSFAERVAGGNLDIPLKMDRQNLFGAFTESFDLMRSELRKAQIAAAKANISKKELVAKLSHDIKTPVASIKAASELGAALSSDDRNRENYGQIIQKADQINTLVTDLFSSTLEELQELSVTPSELKSEELPDLLENADYLHRAIIPPVPACLIYGDRLRLQQVFDNIFANSYKYADTEINVRVNIQNDSLAVCIEDRGGGIDASELPFLKEKFRRGSNTGNIDGAGLGLYISDYCMKKMQGCLDIENGREGLKVTVRLALANRI